MNGRHLHAIPGGRSHLTAISRGGRIITPVTPWHPAIPSHVTNLRPTRAAKTWSQSSTDDAPAHGYPRPDAS